MNKSPKRFLVLLAGVLCASNFASNWASAEAFSLNSSSDSVIGELQQVRSRQEETLIDVAREFGLGYDQIVKSNPKVNRWVPGANAKVLLPNLYVLPDAPKQGLVINLAELRMYYFTGTAGNQSVTTWPVSIGRMDWKTPLGKASVVAKEKDPQWRPPASIKREHLLDGDPLPDVVPGGTPDNPLGHYSLRLSIPGYLIHGVDERKANGIGMRVTHGCIRMYPENVEQVYNMVPVKTPVMLVNQPIKVGEKDGLLYLQVVTPLQEDEDSFFRLSVPSSLQTIKDKAGADYVIDESKAAAAIERGDGVTVVIGKRRSGYSDSYADASGGSDARGATYRAPNPASNSSSQARQPWAPAQNRASGNSYSRYPDEQASYQSKVRRPRDANQEDSADRATGMAPGRFASGQYPEREVVSGEYEKRMQGVLGSSQSRQRMDWDKQSQDQSSDRYEGSQIAKPALRERSSEGYNQAAPRRYTARQYQDAIEAERDQDYY
jgi:L,D-transpeptidase ErfK/SrfK